MKPSMLPALALMALTACVGVAERRAEDRARLDIELVARTGAAPLGAADSEARALLAEPFGPEEAARAALSLAPAVRERLAALDVASAERVRAGLVRNPLLAFEARTSGDGSELDLSLTHPLADLFTLGERREMAALELEAERTRIVRGIVRYVHDVRRAWVDAHVAQRALAVAGELVEAESAAARVARGLHAAGNVIDPVLTDSELSLAAAQRAQVLAERRVHEARERLAAWIGLEGDSGALPLAEVGIDAALQDGQELDIVGAALDSSLDLRELAARTEAAALAAGIAGERVLLDGHEVGFVVRREGGSEGAGPRLVLPLPLFDDGTAARAAAEARLGGLMATQRERALAIASTARALAARLDSERELQRLAQEVRQPLAARRVIEELQRYNAMQVSVFDVLAARRLELAASRDALDDLSSAWRARIDLDELLAGSLPVARDQGGDVGDVTMEIN
jgi:outer membrane protein TolC